MAGSISMRRRMRQERAAIPRRVRLAIARHQDQSERLIGWIQLAIVLMLALLHVFARGHAPADARFSPVPAILGVYGAVTVARLILAYRDRLHGALLTVLAIVDVLLLMLLIWSLRLQYDQPAAFSLKAPLWGYVFLLIALRTLRFEPRYVVIAGVTAMVGWTTLVVHAILSGRGAVVTHDFVSYAYGARVHLGAEIDKLLAIALVTIILALGLARGRRLLVEAVTGSEAAKDLARFFPETIAREITSADQPLLPGQGQVRDAAVVQIDIKSFTRLAAALSADQTIRVLTAYQARVVPIVRAHRGSIDKFLGDGIMAVFVAAGAHPTHARDALAASVEIARTLEGWCPVCAAGEEYAGAAPLMISIGIAHGQTVIGAVGAPGRLEYTVIGHPVNLAAKLEKHTRIEPATVVTAESTLELAEGQGFEPPPETVRRLARISGLDAPLPIAILVPEAYSRITITEQSA